ncbi:MAG: TolC family protein [Synergistaceae bacterium]|jgi:outer membrane protein TolC|nr:TolC family protein [Synergistaceae bacterium]MCK9438207.1 TolC family protein [Synergistaceae bacterium]MDD3319021.1 TolC family protein [Synergistaceae bacterium]
MTKNKMILFSIALALTLTASCRSAEAGAVGINEAIELTLTNNSGLRSLRQETIKAFAFQIQADGTLLPSLSANAYLDRQKESTTNDGERNDNKGARATLEQVIYSGGKNSAIRNQSKQVKNIAEMIIANGENNTVGELYARFYNVLLQRERIKAEESAVNTSQQHLKEVEKMRQLGLANSLEVIRAGQLLATNTANLSTAKGLYESAHISLMNYMGIPPEGRREVTGELSVPEAVGTRQASLEVAREKRADLKRLEEQLEYQKNQILIEKSGTRPKITFGASAGYLNPYLKDDRGDDTWRAELSVTVPIFDRNTSRGNAIKAGAVLEQDKIALEQKELDVKSEVETAWAEIESTLQHLKASEKALELAKESLRLAEVGFREGVTPQLDLLNAQTSLTSARLDHARSQYNHLLTIVALKVTEGTVIEWTGERR